MDLPRIMAVDQGIHDLPLVAGAPAAASAGLRR
jgi:hypothetical protein